MTTDGNRKDWQNIDVRVLGRILAAQNIDFVLPDIAHIAEFFAETLSGIPGIDSCQVCLQGIIIQKGKMDSPTCKECMASMAQIAAQEEFPPYLLGPKTKCQLADQPGMQTYPVASINHHFGFFIVHIKEDEEFSSYISFVNNLANYVALSLENRLQRELLQKSQVKLERKVEERTKELVEANLRLMEEVETRQRAEEALRSSESQIRRLVNDSPVAMLVSSGTEQRVELVNNKFLELFGYTLDDMPDVEHWWPRAYPDEEYRATIKARWEERIEKVIGQQGEIAPMEATVTCKDGTRRYVEFLLSSIGDKHLVTFVDLTERKQAEERLHEREQHSQSLLRLSRKLEQAQSYSEVINAAKEEVGNIVGYKNLWAYLITEDKQYAHSIVASGPIESAVMSEEGPATLAIKGDRMLEEILASTDIVVIEDAQTDERVNKEIVKSLGNRTIINIPIILFDRHLGSIGTGTFGEEGIRIPTDLEREYLMALASHVAVSMDRIHLLTKRRLAEEEIQERERHSQSLLRLSRQFEQAQTYVDALNAAQEEVEKIIGFKNLWAYLFTPDKKQARILFAKGPMSDMVMSKDGTATINIEGDRMMEEFVESKELLVVEDAQTDERTDKLLAAKMGNRTLVNVPILLFDRHLGSVGVGTFFDEGVRIPTASEKEYLSALASHIAVTLDRIHQSTERALMEQALKENEEKFRTLIEQSAEGIMLADEHGNIVEWNRAYEKITGLMRNQVLGLPLWEIMITMIAPERAGEERKKAIKTAILGALRDGKSHLFNASLEMEFVPVGGVDRRYIHQTIFPIKTERGYRIASIIEDITERKRMEETLAKREREFRTLANNSPDNIARYDVNCRTIYVNPTLEKSLGRSSAEMLGITPGVAGFIVEAKEYQNKISETLETGKDAELDLVLPDIGEGLRYHNIRFVAERGADGAITGVLAIGRDFTERKQADLERESIITVSAALRQASTRSEILGVILEQLVQLFQADGAMIAFPSMENLDVVIEMGYGIVGERFTGLRIPQGTGISRWVIENKEPYINNHANEDARFYRSDLLGEAHCVASAPLITQERSIGALWIARRIGISENDLRILKAIADIAANAIHRITLHEQMEMQLHRLMALHHIDLAISGNYDLNVTLNVILSSVKNELEVDAADILLLDPITNDLDYACGLGFRMRDIEASHVRLGEDITGRAALGNAAASYLDLKNIAEHFSRSTLLANEKFTTYFVCPLTSKGQIQGVLEVFTRKPFVPEKDWLDYFETLATQTAIAVESAQLFENLQRSNTELVLAYDATIEGWSLALDLRDKETEGHTRRVMQMTLDLAGKMGLSDAEKLDIKRGSLLHDIGKMGVPDSILLKPGPLSLEEWTVMRQHPAYALKMLSSISYLKKALEIPYNHHEHWDGSGYPRGLKGEEIPLSARVFSVIDVFDALTSDRPYRRAWPPEKAYAFIASQSGKLFDPRVVATFLQGR